MEFYSFMCKPEFNNYINVILSQSTKNHMLISELNFEGITTGVALAAFISLMNPLDLAKNRLQTMPELIAHGHL